ncbi:MraY family glycosyltransferase [Azospirillum picis]|uniref:UDP-N-acetylmuramyl pentapeptide phosphotransferase/UDP-N-acetylglucosamine-1-phosphate transferase n=1 Tax=Azospirillum picis TaxID=488438 RepID=A0ABU0MIL4_9PROT|nr:glycosyltransferase family 4 protein [Azospirillum picis]MBP2299606.1 UDP-N-acetylmuramyl pentapeptide phosphotransferase/UDP-N-acetylglucosamine-1-phosphate transferase [Azospirillum picis]MDQ0533267.1 UDP-N-acetylmuramyl pentapeptide phosphotransferase/UDP-N-acetylglucosamine-1-phosphate transferase [Azospirillum picis]
MSITAYSSALAGVFLLCLAAGWYLSTRVLRWLLASRILDIPNERSSHQAPTPRGGGWAVMLTVVPVFAAAGLAFGKPLETAVVLLGTLALMAVSWIDDRRPLSPLLRLVVQAMAVVLGLLALPTDELVWQGWLPWGLDRAATAFLWLWFVNLYNFMDGIDGLAGSETILIGGGVALVSLAMGDFGLTGVAGAALAGAAAGFLTHNWRPARMFMGDVGSIPLGHILAFLLATLAAHGDWAAALILPAYYLTDATITLLRRLLRGEKIWQAHREHFYQKAAKGVGRHDRVVLTIIGYSLLLLAAALAAGSFGAWTLLPGIVTVALLLATLKRMAKA